MSLLKKKNKGFAQKSASHLKDHLYHAEPSHAVSHSPRCDNCSSFYSNLSSIFLSSYKTQTLKETARRGLTKVRRDKVVVKYRNWLRTVLE